MTLRTRANQVFRWIYTRCFRTSERLFGPGILSLMALPEMAFQIVYHAWDYRQFQRLRAGVPAEFWKGISPARHFYLMYRNWTGSLTVQMFYDRLLSPAWRKRIAVHGTPPNLLAEWGQQPVVIGCLHTGGLPLLNYWLRANGTPSALFSGGFTRAYQFNQKIRDAGDRLYGLVDVPHMPLSTEPLRKLVRYLQPGRVLIMTLEQVDFSKPLESYPLDGRQICLNQAALRLASLSGAILMPAAVRQTGLYEFEITFGRPVPAEAVKEGNLRDANLHLVHELWPDLKEDPSQITWTLLEALSPDRKAPRLSWP